MNPEAQAIERSTCAQYRVVPRELKRNLYERLGRVGYDENDCFGVGHVPVDENDFTYAPPQPNRHRCCRPDRADTHDAQLHFVSPKTLSF
jgi:hypothetical protein